MDYASIFALIQKGLTVVQALQEAGKTALPAIKALQALASGAGAGSVTDEQLTAAEAVLDAQIEEFNLKI